MTKIKVMTVVGTRPEIIKLSRVIACLDEHTQHCLVHTGQNYDYELNEIFFNELGLRKPDHYLEVAGASPTETIGRVIMNIDPVLEKENPDALLILGDTNSCLCAISAKRRKIPIFHMEAGNRCFDQRVPEENNRKIIDHISDINLPYSDIAREYLLREGFPAERIIKTGSPMLEVINHYSDKIKNSHVLSKLGLQTKDYFLVSAHREENIDYDINLLKLANLLNYLASDYGKRVIVSTHPRTRKKFLEKDIKLNSRVELLNRWVSRLRQLELNAYTVLSDSGTITKSINS